MRIGTSLALGTESGQIEHAETAAYMPLRTQRPQFAEPSVVMLAWRKPGLLADVLVEAVVAIGTIS